MKQTNYNNNTIEITRWLCSMLFILSFTAMINGQSCMTVGGNLDNTGGIINLTLDGTTSACAGAGGANTHSAYDITGTADLGGGTINITQGPNFDFNDVPASGIDLIFVSSAGMLSGMGSVNFPTIASSNPMQDLVFTASIVGNDLVVNIVDPCNPDAEAPTMVCNGTFVFTLSSAQDGAATFTLDDTDLRQIATGTTDNCKDFADLVFSVDISTFDCSNIGVNNIEITVSDGVNMTSCNTMIDIQDGTNPVAVCPDPVGVSAPLWAQGESAYVEIVAGIGTLPANELAGGNSTDNCATTIETSPMTMYDCDDIGIQMVELKVTDGVGKENTIMCNVIVGPPLPTADAGNSSESAQCSGTDVSVTLDDYLDGGSEAADYALVSTNYNGMSGSASISGGETLEDNVTNTTGGQLDVEYTITPVHATSDCPGTDFIVTIPIDPEPVYSDGTETECSDIALNYDLSSTSVNGLTDTYTYTVASSDATNVPPGADRTTASNANITDTYNNVTSAAVTITYTVTPTSADGCEGDAFDVVVTINPEPVGVNYVNGSILSFDFYNCSGDLLSWNLQNNVNDVVQGGNAVPSTYDWSAAYPAGISGGAGTATGVSHINETLVNSTAGSLDVVYTITPTSLDGCVGSDFTITWTIDPAPESEVSAATETICSGDSPTATTGSLTTAPDGVGDAYLIDAVLTSGTATGFTASQSGVSASTDIDAADITNTSDAVAVVTYSVSAYTFGEDGLDDMGGGDDCVDATPATVLVTVEPVPTATLTFTDPDPATFGANNVICSGYGMNNITLATTITPSSLVQMRKILTLDGVLQFDVVVPLQFYNDMCAGCAVNTGTDYIDWVIQCQPHTAGPDGVFNTGDDCLGAMETTTYQIEPVPQANDPADEEICSGFTTDFDVTTDLVITNTSFNWTAAYGAVTGGAGSATSVAYGTDAVNDGALSNVTAADIDVTYTITPYTWGPNEMDDMGAGDDCPGTPFDVVVTVKAEPVVADQTVTQCSDVALGVNFNASTSIAAATYNVTALNLNGLTVSAGGAAVANGLADTDLADDAFTNTTSAAVDVVYTVVPVSADDCEGASFTVTATIDPEPVGVSSTETVCSDEAFSYDPQDNVDDTGGNAVTSTFAWTAVYDAGLTGGVGSGTGLVAESLNNVSGGDLTATYTITPTSDPEGCEGSTFTITVTVNSEPVGADSTEEVCSDEAFSFDPQDNVDDTANGGNSVSSTFAWTAVYDAGLTGGAGSGTGNVAETLNNVTGGDLDATYTITPTSDPEGCEGSTFTITVTVNPEPVVSDIARETCSGERLDDGGADLLPSLSDNGLDIGAEADAWVITSIAPEAGLTFVSGADVGDVPITTTNNNLLDNDEWENKTLVDLDVVFTVTPTADNGCEGDPFTITVTIHPEPVAVDLAFTVCSGDTWDGTGDWDVSSYFTNFPTEGVEWTRTKLGSADNNEVDGEPNSQGAYNMNDLVSGGAVVNNSTTPKTITYRFQNRSAVNECDGDAFDVAFTINPHVSATIDAAGDLSLCVDEMRTLGIIGLAGVAPYTYAWTIDGTSTATGSFDDAALSSPTLTALTAGNLVINLQVADADGCMSAVSTETFVVSDNPIANDAELEACEDVAGTGQANFTLEDADADVLGTQDPLDFTVTYHGSQSDANGGIGDLSSPYNSIDGFVIARVEDDDTGCYSTSTVTLTVHPLPVLEVSGTDVLCNGGATGTAQVVVTNLDDIGITTIITSDYTGDYAPGNWTTNGPASVAHTATTMDLEMPAGTGAENNVSITAPDDVTISFDWTYETTDSPFWDPFVIETNGVPMTITAGAGNTQSGSETFVVNAGNDFSMGIHPLDGVGGVASISVDNFVFTTAGTPLDIEWSTGDTDASISGLSAGTYTVTVTSDFGCEAEGSVTIDEPTEIIATASGTDETCDGDEDGTITVNASGGTSGYMYSIDGTTFQRENLFEDLAPGSYTVTVKDANGCEVIVTPDVVIGDGAIITASITSDPDHTDPLVEICPGEMVELTASGTGGTGTYIYEWDDASSNAIRTVMPGGGTTTYSVTITDGNGCEGTQSIMITTIVDSEDPTFSGCTPDAPPGWTKIEPTNGDPDTLVVTVSPAVCFVTPDWDAPVASDNCVVVLETNNVDPFYTPSGGTNSDGIYDINYHAEDGMGNDVDCDFVLKVIDGTDPNILACPADIDEDTDTDMCSLEITYNSPAVNDQCGILSWSVAYTMGTPAPATVPTGGPLGSTLSLPVTFTYDLGETIVTYTATDGSGNTATCEFSITVTEDDAPSFEDTDDITVNTEDDASECPAVASLSLDPSGGPVVVGSGDTYMVAGTSQTAPALEGTYDATAGTYGNGGYADACDDAPVLTLESAVFDAPDGCSATWTLTWRVTDHYDNFVEQVQVYTIEDKTFPTWDDADAMLDLSADCEDDIDALVAANIPAATDNCSNLDGTSVVEESDDTTPGTCAGNYVRTVTYSVSDLCGNDNPTIYTVTIDVTDTDGPTLIGASNSEIVDVDLSDIDDVDCIADVMTLINAIPQDTDLTTDIVVGDPAGDNYSIIITALEALFEDNCSAYAVQLDSDEFEEEVETVNCVVEYQLPFIAIDECGNEGETYTINITFTDDIPAAFDVAAGAYDVDLTTMIDGVECPEDAELLDENDDDLVIGLEVALGSDINIGGIDVAVPEADDIEDACGILTMTIKDLDDDDADSCEREITITWEISDGCSLDATNATFEQVITITDDTPVVVNGDDDDELEFTTSTGSNCPDETIADLLDGDLIVGASFGSTQTFDIAGEADAGTFAAFNVTDNCQDVQFKLMSITDDEDDCDRMIVLTWEASDGCNAAEIVTHSITISDDSAPDITACTDDRNMMHECTGAAANEVAADAWHAANILYLLGCASENCSTPIVEYTYDYANLVAGCGETGVLSVTYILTDNCENDAAPITYTFTVVDTTAPDVASCTDQSTTHECTGAADNELVADAWHLANIAALESCALEVCGDITVNDDYDYANLTDGCGETGVLTVTYSVTDECTNTSSDEVYTFTIMDTTAPDVTSCTDQSTTHECTGAADNELVADAWHLANIAALESCASEVCGDITVNDDYDYANLTDGCGDTGVLTVTYSVTDACTNKSTDEVYTFTIMDTTAPDVTSCTDQSTTHECTGAADNETAADAWHLANIAALELCASEACGDITVNDDYDYANLTDGCGETGVLTVTYSVTDECTNTSSDEVYTFTIMDTTAPDVTSCTDQSSTHECDGAAGNEAAADAWHLANIAALELCASEVCGDITVNDDYDFANLTDGCGITGVLTVTYSVTDECTNTSTDEVYTFTIEDNTVPSWDDVPGLPADDEEYVSSSDCEYDLVMAVPTAMDDCDDNVTVSLVALNVDGDAISVQEVAGIFFVTLPQGVNTLTLTAADDCDNNIMHEWTFEVIDEIDPTITCPLDEQVDCIDEVPDVYANAFMFQLAGGIVDDNCTLNPASFDMILEETVADVLGSCVDTLKRTYYIEDESGNSNTCIHRIIIKDEIDPELADEPAAVTVECGDSTDPADTGMPTATDNCDTDVDITYDDVVDLSGCGGYTGTITRTWTATDECDNTDTYVQVITIEDTTAPVASATGITVELDGAGIYTFVAQDLIDMTVGATDACADDATQLSYSVDPLFVDCSSGNPVTVTVTVTDPCTNSIDVDVEVTIEDNVDPEVTCPTPAASYGTDAGVCVANLDLPATATDNCGVPTITYSIGGTAITMPYDFPVGTTTVDVVATDGSSNTDECSFDVVVEDDEAPTFTCPVPAASYDSDAGMCSASLSFDVTDEADNCGVASVEFSVAAAAITFPYDFPVGTTTVDVLVTDDNGLTADCSFDVVVVDVEAPTFTCPVPAASYDSDAGMCSASLSFDVTDEADNCGVASVEFSVASAAITMPYDFPVGTTTVDVLVTDDNGLTADCNFDVVVVDVEAPTFTCPVPAASYDSDAGMCSASLTFDVTDEADNCGVASVEFSVASAAITMPYDFPVGTTTVDVLVTDDNGLTADCSFDVVVVDVEAPTFTCPVPAASYDSDAGLCSASLTFDVTDEADNCGVASVEFSVAAAAITFPYDFPVGTTTVDVLVTDIHGLTADCSYDVVVVDAEAPTFTCPVPDASYDSDTGMCSASLSFAVTDAMDNCGIASVEYSVDSAPITYPYVFPVGTTTVDVLVTDDNGLTADCSFDVVVVDAENPMISCPASVTIATADADECTIDYDGVATISDNCSIASAIDVTVEVVLNLVAGGTGPTGTVTLTNDGSGNITIDADDLRSGDNVITLTAIDVAGNESTCEFTVTVEDTFGPQVNDCPDDIVVTAPDGDCTMVVNWAPVVFNDPCDNFTISNTHNSGDAFPVGETTTVTWIATDDSGNTAECTFDVTVNGDCAPEVDLTPVYVGSPGTFTAGQTRDVVVRVRNLLTDPTEGTVQFFVPNNGGFTKVFDPALTTATVSSGTISVDNADWTVTVLGTGLLFKSTAPPIGGLSSSYVSIQVTADTPGISVNMQSTLSTGTGGDNNNANNSRIKILSVTN